jgi:IS30 family transposase
LLGLGCPKQALAKIVTHWQYFTKGSRFETITDEDVEQVMNKLNHRPRKTLNFKTPHQVFFDETDRNAA